MSLTPLLDLLSKILNQIAVLAIILCKQNLKILKSQNFFLCLASKQVSNDDVIDSLHVLGLKSLSNIIDKIN